jgi:hypothetical protein
MALDQLLDALVAADQSGKALSIDTLLTSIPTAELDDLRRDAEANYPGLPWVLAAIEGEITARFVARQRAVRPQSLAREGYERAWHDKRNV